MNDLIVHTINIAHYRLIQLTQLADQAKPFYDWVEKQAKRITGSHRSLNEILLNCSKIEIAKIIKACYENVNDEKPLLFDGIGRVYPHSKACFYFFAWMIRDAPQQRLSPLISRMQKADNVTKIMAETDALVELIFEYRSIVKSFDWSAVREVVIDRLEGSRRSISGHHLEANVRTSLITAIQHYYSIYGNYGQFKKIDIADKQIKLGKHTIDVSVELTPKIGTGKVGLLIPVKTRETEGGGHSHLFTRDIITAISDIKKEIKNYHVVAIIVAENWSASEIATLDNQIHLIFHFNMNPNKFIGFDEAYQVKFNKYIETIRLSEDSKINMENRVILGDARKIIPTFEDNFFQAIITSPPYFGQRRYSDGENQAEIGQKSDVEIYIANLVSLFRELRNKLKPDGLLWLNLGDTYRNKLLLGIPWRVALSLQADGWILRSDIIWHKPNAMPSSIKDRPTTDHEYIFMFAKSPEYYYNADAIREPHVTFTEKSRMKGGRNHFGKINGTPELGKNSGNQNLHDGRWDQAFHPKGRNKRTVWEIPLSKFRDVHFAVYPEKLVEICLLASTREQDFVLDPFTGSGTTGVVAGKLFRKFIGIELVEKYQIMAQDRIDLLNVQLNLFHPLA